MNLARDYAKQLGIAIEAEFGLGKIQLEIFEKTVEEKLRASCFITAYPTEVSPLARRNELDPSRPAKALGSTGW